MSKYTNQINQFNPHKGLQKLTDDLVAFGANTSSTQMVDSEMLSLVVSDVLDGTDISIRYPAFYRKILNNGDLRQAFMDAIDSMEEQKQREVVDLPLTVRPSLAFLSHPRQSQLPTIIRLGADRWRSIWRQSIEELQSIFSPPELAYRSDPSLYEDPWITVLRAETEIDGAVYAFMLECSPAEESDDALAVSFNIAVTMESPVGVSQTSLEATLQWGLYNETIAISEEGRTRFPDIPLIAILDEGQQNFIADLSLALEKIS
jgi:hypothetical protein